MLRWFPLACALIGAAAVVGVASGGGNGWARPDGRDRALLASVMHGMRTDLRSVKLTQLRAELRRGRSRKTLDLVTATSVKRSQRVRSTRADWDALLIGHAYNERCVRDADHCLWVGRSGAEKPFWTEKALSRGIRQRFTAAGLQVISIAFEHPNAFAPIITVTSPKSGRAALQAENHAMIALNSAFRHAEGRFVEMLGPHGRLLLIQSGSGNTGEGWCAPTLKCPTP
jgi:hypothetical protein